MSAVRSELEPEEVAFFDELGPPTIEVSTLDGERCISVFFYGSETRTEWDGTEADAVACVLGSVDSAASSISDGYWTSGGWKTRVAPPPK